MGQDAPNPPTERTSYDEKLLNDRSRLRPFSLQQVLLELLQLHKHIPLNLYS